jgi:hypothetical protein
MNERDIELVEQAGLLGPSSQVGNSHEAAERFVALIREDERKEIRAQMTRLVIVPTLTHGILVKLTDVDAAIRTRGNI